MKYFVYYSLPSEYPEVMDWILNPKEPNLERVLRLHFSLTETSDQFLKQNLWQDKTYPCLIASFFEKKNN